MLNRITVMGRLQLRDWTDRDGNKRRSAEGNYKANTFLVREPIKVTSSKNITALEAQTA